MWHTLVILEGSYILMGRIICIEQANWTFQSFFCILNILIEHKTLLLYGVRLSFQLLRLITISQY